LGAELILDAARAIAAQKEAADVVAQVEAVVDAFGFDFYGIVRQPKPNEDPLGLLLAGRWPEGWPELYIRKKYVVIDPTIRFLSHAQRGFRWRDTMSAFAADPQGRRMMRMMMDAGKFGLHDGYIFPVHGRRGLLGNLTVGGRSVELSAYEMTLFDMLAKAAFWRLLELRSPELNRTLSAHVDVRLTHREMEALNYLSDGMTSPEVASVLDLSNHTVDWYMNGIQQKLNARNRHHAVAIAFRLGLIS
jgi:LuxR family transcriptional regulator, quorum-sensing system regulator SdiA